MNLGAFIDAIEDEDLQLLIREQVDNILKIGSPNGQENREAFFEALQNIIDKRISEE